MKDEMSIVNAPIGLSGVQMTTDRNVSIATDLRRTFLLQRQRGVTVTSTGTCDVITMEQASTDLYTMTSLVQITCSTTEYTAVKPSVAQQIKQLLPLTVQDQFCDSCKSDEIFGGSVGGGAGRPTLLLAPDFCNSLCYANKADVLSVDLYSGVITNHRPAAGLQH